MSALALAAMLPTCGRGDARGDGPPPPNVVFLCVDTLRADFTGPFGDTSGRTPRLDALAAEGVVFERVMSHASWTLPSFAAVLTSLYSSTTRCWTFESRLDESFTTLPEIFRDAGYDTAGVGSHVFFNADYGLQQGFDWFDDELAYKRNQAGWEPVTSPRVSGKAVAWLDARAVSGDTDPFLLWLHYFDPHFPYLPHEGGPDAGEDSLANYKGEIGWVDRWLGEVLDALERNGHAQDTVIVFLADHGEAFGEHEGITRHSHSLYNEEARVPLVFRVPGVAPRRVDAIVRSVDVLPTLLELCGLQADPSQPMMGHSLLSALRGGPVPPASLLQEIRLKEDGQLQALVRSPWKLIENLVTGRVELYDLDRDPMERHDVSADQPEAVAALRAELAAQRAAAEALGERYAGGGTVQLSPEELARLTELGYVGDDN